MKIQTLKMFEIFFEMRLHEVFSEAHEVKKNHRNGTFEYGVKWIEHVLGSKVILNIEEGIELIECDEIVDSDNRGCLTDLNLELNFEEQFNAE